MREPAKKIAEALNKLLKNTRQDMLASGKSIADTVNSGQQFTLWLTAAVVVMSVLCAWMISHGLLKQLGGEPSDAAEIARRIADGDLTVAVTTKAGDHSSMMFAMKTMRANLADIVSRVRTGTDAIATASNQIAAGNLDLSLRTEQQAASLEETASSMEEMASTVKQNADNARQANQLAVSASEVAVKGGAVVAQVVDTMDAINELAKKLQRMTNGTPGGEWEEF